ncbi:MAG: DUF262 domain-containing protein [Burkholderiales bacterium]
MAKKRQAATSTKTIGQDVLVQDGVLDINEAAEVVPFTYAITAFGADYPVSSLVQRIKEKAIFVPLFSLPTKAKSGEVRFQREYVWKKQQADRFIESLLLGLPVPGIFLVKEEDGRNLVLDGHQRLKTLARFYENDWEGGEFVLDGVQERFRGKGYKSLESPDRRRLDDSVIHATVIRQDEPSEDKSSIYLIFERLNSGGTSLQPQEIRVALYHGPFVQLLTELNMLESWRKLFGRRSSRLKDVELILRFFSLLEAFKRYSRPMKGFLSAYMARRRNLDSRVQREFRDLFEATCEAILKGIGRKAFRLKVAVNAALVDALMVGVAARIQNKGPIKKSKRLKIAYQRLLRNMSFQRSISRATADEENVRTRLRLGIRAFKKI